MNVSAIIVTRGDVDLGEIVESIPLDWELLFWDNGARELIIFPATDAFPRKTNDVKIFHTDLAVYGRYAAIEHASHDLIYVQDDDVIVSDPEIIVRCWMSGNSFDSSKLIRTAREVRPDLACNYKEAAWISDAAQGNVRDWGYVVCNMPPEFRHDFYTDHALIGFGAVFHRDAPAKAFAKWNDYYRIRVDGTPAFNRACDVVFTALTPRILVDVPKHNLPWADTPARMWRQPEHVGERKRMLDLVRSVRDH